MADVVSNKGIEDESRVITGLLAGHGVDDTRRLHCSRTSAVDTDVLEVPVVAEVPLSHLEVDRLERASAVAGGVVEVSGSPRSVRPVELVFSPKEDVVVRRGSDRGSVQVLRWKSEVGSGAVSKDDHSSWVTRSTVKVFVGLVLSVGSLDTVAVVIKLRRKGGRVASRVDISRERVAVLSSPVRSTECTSIREEVAIDVKDGVVEVSKTVDRVLNPLEESTSLVREGGDALEGETLLLREETALGKRADTKRLADVIRRGTFGDEFHQESTVLVEKVDAGVGNGRRQDGAIVLECLVNSLVVDGSKVEDDGEDHGASSTWGTTTLASLNGVGG